MKTAIFILGMHRSGTSALGGTLDLMGLEFGSDLMGADAGNPKGYFENNFVYQLNEKILNEAHSSWDDYRFELNKVDSSKKQEYIKEAKEIIDQEFRYAKNFVIKDPRNCLLFSLWQEACKELEIDIKVVLPYRNPVEVAASLKKRNNFSYEKSLILWAKHFLSAEYLSRGLERIFTTFDELITQTDATLQTLESFTGLPVPQAAKEYISKEFLDSSVKHNNISLANFTQDTPSFLQRILQVIQEKDFDEQVLDEIRKDFLFSLDFFQHQELFDTVDKLQHENKLLDEIKDITKVDTQYYLEKYEDIKDSEINPLEHFMEYGKKEGRYPNRYTEHKALDTREISSSSEELFHLNSQLQQKEQELAELNSECLALNTQKTELETQTLEEITHLQYENKLLDEIKDITKVDTQYYLEKYEDIKDSEINPLEHFMEYGKKEGRYPNRYTEHKALDTREISSSSEELFHLNSQLQQKLQETQELESKLDAVVNDLASVKEINVQQKAELENQIAQITSQLEQKSEELKNSHKSIKQLQEQNSQKEQELAKLNSEYLALNTEHSNLKEEYTQKLQEIQELESNLDTVVNDLASVKEINVQQKTELENQIAQITSQLEQKSEELKNSHKSIEQLQEQNSQKEQELAKLNSEYLALNTEHSNLSQNLDEVVEDLASIKESKCWIYTKPIRELQKTFGGR